MVIAHRMLSMSGMRVSFTAVEAYAVAIGERGASASFDERIQMQEHSKLDLHEPLSDTNIFEKGLNGSKSIGHGHVPVFRGER